MMRHVLHINVDDFYASVARVKNPALLHRSLIVSHLHSRGTVVSASYEARADGVRPGLTLAQARRLAPRARVIPFDAALFSRASEAVFRILAPYSPLVERTRLDEGFLDYTGCERLLGGPLDACARIQREIRDRLAPFRPTSGLHVETRTGGERVLPVRLHTDITDVAFLELFRDAVESEFSRSEAARSRRFAVDLSWEQVPPERLYPEGPPARGATIDVDRHRERFPMLALVFTTGAESTHAWQGRSVLLGSAPVTRRTLAHEFGHLLGFDDAYVRGFDGDPRGAYGVVLVEWSGLKDDLMGNPGTGRVTEAMIDQLIEAYGDP